MIRKLLAVSAGLSLALMLPACGGSSSNPVSTTPPTTTPPCTQSVVLQGSAPLASRTADFETFTTTTTGRVDVTLDWTFPDSLMGVFVYQGACSFDQFVAQACNFLIAKASPPKPLKGSTVSLSPGTYGLIIGNGSNRDESVSLQVVASSAGCPALTSVATSDASRLSVTRMLRGVFGH